MRRSRWVAALAVPLLLAACTAPGGSDSDAQAGVSLAPTDPPVTADPTAAGLVAVGVDGSSDGTLDTAALTSFPLLAASAQRCDGVPVPPDADPASVDAAQGDAAQGDAASVAIEVVAAYRQVLGVRCESTAGARTVYTDAASGRVWQGGELVSDAGHAIVSPAFAEVTGDDVADPFADVRFDTEGDLVLVHSDGTAWRLRADETDALLTDAGRVVRGSVRSGGAFVGAIATTAQVVPAPASAPLPAPPVPPAPVTPPAAGVDCAVAKCLALTFDDGPGPDTPRLLQILADKDVKATFFMVGSNVSRYPSTVKAIADAGHELANHTWNHPNLTTLSAGDMASEIQRTSQAIVDAAGQAPDALRPPYGAVDDAVLAEAGRDGMAVVLWNVDSEDWKSKNAQATHDRVITTAKQNGIVLMHDIHSWTIDAVPSMIDDLRAQGYTFVTVEQLLGGSMQPGTKHFSGG